VNGDEMKAGEEAPREKGEKTRGMPETKEEDEDTSSTECKESNGGERGEQRVVGRKERRR